MWTALVAIIALVATVPASARTPYIIAGTEVTEPGRWPSMCALLVRGQFICGCTVIDQEWVLTAAHCVQNFVNGLSALSIAFNTFDRQGMNPSTNPDVIIRNIAKVIMHEEFEDWIPTGNPNDIAVMKLTEPVQFTSTLFPWRLAPDDGYDYTDGKHECWIVGWGRSKFTDYYSHRFLQEAKVDAVDWETCTGQYWSPTTINETMHICIFDTQNKQISSCMGDSGGPLFCNRDGQFAQVGVTSWLHYQCNPGFPQMYARVSTYYDWIIRSTGLPWGSV